jgi:hypothetical protein
LAMPTFGTPSGTPRYRRSHSATFSATRRQRHSGGRACVETGTSAVAVAAPSRPAGRHSFAIPDCAIIFANRYPRQYARTASADRLIPSGVRFPDNGWPPWSRQTRLPGVVTEQPQRNPRRLRAAHGGNREVIAKSFLCETVQAQRAGMYARSRKRLGPRGPCFFGIAYLSGFVD